MIYLLLLVLFKKSFHHTRLTSRYDERYSNFYLKIDQAENLHLLSDKKTTSICIKVFIIISYHIISNHTGNPKYIVVTWPLFVCAHKCCIVFSPGVPFAEWVQRGGDDIFSCLSSLSLTHCHFRIWTQRMTFETKRQKDKNDREDRFWTALRSRAQVGQTETSSEVNPTFANSKQMSMEVKF